MKSIIGLQNKCIINIKQIGAHFLRGNESVKFMSLKLKD